LKGGLRQLEAALSGHVIAHHQELLTHARRCVWCVGVLAC
jgi:hypothetical protein